MTKEIAGIELARRLGLIAGLAETIRAERDYPRRTSLRNQLTEVRQTRRFDEADSIMLSFLEPNVSDRPARTPERVRAKAHRAIIGMPKGKSRNFPRPEGMSAATQCAFVVSVLLNWPRKGAAAQDLCATLWAFAGGDPDRRRGSKDRKDGFWRDHLREARKWQNTPGARLLAARIEGQ
jgi:hypothetical protein